MAVLANRDDTFPAEIAVRIAGRLTGTPAPARPARLGRPAAVAAEAGHHRLVARARARH